MIVPILLLVSALAVPAGAAAQGHGHDASEGEGAGPRLVLKGFSNLDFEVPFGALSPGETENRTSFALGQFGLYMTSRLSDNISFLGETVFEMNESQETAVDVERVQINYRWSDRFRLTLGRGHTALGYWNDAYHHGALLQPTVARPEALRFEDDGGILPVHFVGADVRGEVGIAQGGWNLGYVGYVANGRGIEPDVVQGLYDANKSKAVGGRLRLSREGRRTVMFGPMAYHDVFPPVAGQPGREVPISETILGAHFVYRDRRFDLFSEYFHIRDDVQQGGPGYTNKAAYAIGVLHFGRWSPYGGVDWMDIDPGDPYFQGYSDLTRVLVGVRFDLVGFNCLKVEYQRNDRPWGVAHLVVLQSAFAF